MWGLFELFSSVRHITLETSFELRLSAADRVRYPRSDILRRGSRPGTMLRLESLSLGMK
jgi:hypothetical protein